MKTVRLSALTEALQGFLRTYFTEEAARRSAEVILWAECRGKTGQGLLKLSGTEPLQSIIPTRPPQIIDKTPLSALIQAHRNPSFYMAQLATDLAIEKAMQNGFAAIGINGLFSSTGALGFYAERLADANLIGTVCARCPASIVPFNLSVPLFGTNPIAIAFPTNEQPLVFDMATSAITWYELVLARLKGLPIPENVALDAEGNPTIDAKEAMRGGLLPFDRGHKGAGLAMAVEMLSGPLVGAAACDNASYDKDWGMLVLAFTPALLGDLGDFKTACSAVIATIRQQPTSDGLPVRLPGDAARAQAEIVTKTGNIAIEDEAAKLLGL